MRLYFLTTYLTCLFVSSLAQPIESTRRAGRTKSVVYSASSDWQKVTLKSTTRLRPAESVPPASAPERTTRSAPPPAAENEVAGRTRPTVVPVPPPASAPAASSATGQPRVLAEPVSQPVARAEPVPPPRYVPPTPSATGYRPAFTGDFVTNRNGWRAGNRGDYYYQIGVGKYNIRKRNANTNQIAFSYVPLPSEINLNVAQTFTIKVDVVADSGRVPAGGLLFGVADSLNYCAFSLNSRGEVSIIRVTNGATSSDYMPGDYFRPGILLEKNRDRLTIRRTGDLLHFYVNEQEIRSSPYPFRLLPGNGIGLTTTGYWTSFQKLTVTLGP